MFSLCVFHKFPSICGTLIIHMCQLIIVTFRVLIYIFSLLFYPLQICYVVYCSKVKLIKGFLFITKWLI